MNLSYYGDLLFYVVVTLLLSALVAAGLAVYLAVEKLMTRDRPPGDARFAGRRPLTLDAFFEQFYAVEAFPRAVVQEVLVAFSEAAQLPHALLRPQDSFSSLHVAESDSTRRCAADAAALLSEGERRFGVRLLAGMPSTLDDYIRVYCLAQRLASRGGSAGR